MLDLCLELLPLCFSPQPLPTPSLSDCGTRPHPSSDACQEASRVFWFCLQQLHLNGDIVSADFHPDWQLQQHVWPKFVQQVCAVPLHSTDTPSSPSRFASAVLVCVALIPLVDSVSRQQFHAKRRVLAPNSPFCDHSCRQVQPCPCNRASAGLVTRHWHLQPPGVPCDSSRRECRVRLPLASVWPSSHFSARSLGVLCVHLSQFSSDFARDLIAARVPFGRLLDEHQVKRVVQVGRTCKACVCLPHFTSWRVWAGP